MRPVFRRRAHDVVAGVPARFAHRAIAPVSGLDFPPVHRSAGSVLTFHGLADPQNPYDGHAAGRGAEWLESVHDALAGWARHDWCKGDVDPR